MMEKIEGSLIRYKNTFGSLDHYYHYLLALLVPVVIDADTRLSINDNRTIYIRSCGVMDRLVEEVKLPNVKILESELHAAIFEKRNKVAKVGNVDRIKKVGFDNPSSYNFEAFTKAKEILTKYLSVDIISETENIMSRMVSGKRNVLMIRRESGLNYYKKITTGTGNSGAERRSIPNFNELVNAVNMLPNVNVVTDAIQEKSLAYQIALFSNFDIIVCQHGATLANTIWCKPNSHVVEIYPDGIEQYLVDHNHFFNIAQTMGFNYHRVEQTGLHDNVNPALLLKTISEILTNGQN